MVSNNSIREAELYCVMMPFCSQYNTQIQLHCICTRESHGRVELVIEIVNLPGGAPRPFTVMVNTQDGTASQGSVVPNVGCLIL